MKGRILNIILFVFCSLCANGQIGILDSIVNLSTPIQEIKNHLADLEELAKIEITYSPSQIDDNQLVGVSLSRQTIRDHLSDILKGLDIKIVLSKEGTNRIVLVKDKSLKKAIVKGIVLDQISGDPLIGVQLNAFKSKSISFTDVNGYFQISVDAKNDLLSLELIGYEDAQINIDSPLGDLMKIQMKTSNIIPQVLITGSEIRNYIGLPGAEKLVIRNAASYTNFLGDNNVIDELRTLPAVQSGSEGQTGIFVRGGGTDQNLLLFEGVPLYESSHLAGLSSIFVSDAVKDILFFADGFPAQYGGRLSSIIDLSLKSGRTDKIVGSATAAITGTSLYSSGPISDKLSFNVAGKLSWVNLYLNPFLKKSYSYRETDLGFHDITGKLHYQIDETTSLSLTAYSGKDRILLDRETSSIDSTLILNDFTNVEWQNNLIALNYKSILSDNWAMHTHISGLNYRQSTRGVYGQLERDLSGNFLRDNTKDVISFSSISDINAYTDLSYHYNEQVSFKIGAGRLLHKYNPTIRQSKEIEFDNTEVLIAGDSAYIAKEDYIYGEFLIKAFKNLDISAGVRASNYKVSLLDGQEEQKYRFREPRLSIIYTPWKDQYFSFSYNQMVQYVHLLVNPSAGLPADLWVPSTRNISPEFAEHFSLGYSLQKKKFNLSLNAYVKQYDQALDYSSAFDLFFSILNSEEFIPIYTSSNEWDRRVSSGIGLARGWELRLNRVFPWGKINAAYSRSKSTRMFDDIDNGMSFPFTFNRSHDINISTNIDLSDKWHFAAKWVYGTGSAFTLAIEEFRSPEGIRLRRADGRNNYFNAPFHHLDLNMNRIFKYNQFACRFTFGVYNAYNRLNPFYTYLYIDPNVGQPKLRQISIFPVIPHLSFKVNW